MTVLKVELPDLLVSKVQCLGFEGLCVFGFTIEGLGFVILGS